MKIAIVGAGAIGGYLGGRLALNGEIVRLAKTIDAPAPINETIVRLIREAEKKGEGSRRWRRS